MVGGTPFFVCCTRRCTGHRIGTFETKKTPIVRITVVPSIPACCTGHATRGVLSIEGPGPNPPQGTPLARTRFIEGPLHHPIFSKRARIQTCPLAKPRSFLTCFASRVLRRCPPPCSNFPIRAGYTRLSAVLRPVLTDGTVRAPVRSGGCVRCSPSSCSAWTIRTGGENAISHTTAPIGPRRTRVLCTLRGCCTGLILIPKHRTICTLICRCHFRSIFCDVLSRTASRCTIRSIVPTCCRTVS